MTRQISARRLQDRPHLLLATPPSEPISVAAKAIRWPCLLPALTTALLLTLCHFTILPIASGWFAWFALVPMLCLVRSEARPRRVYLAAWAGGLAFFWFVLQWMRVADIRMYATWAMLATYCSLFVPLGVFLIRRLDRHTRLPMVVTVPVVWTGLEFIRAHLLTGFPWYFLGHTQHNFLPAIQIADLGGVYAVTFVVAAVNAMLFEMLYARRGFRAWLALPVAITPRRPGVVWQALGVALLVGGTLTYGAWRLQEDAFQQGPRVALLQGNEPQAVRNARYNDVEEAQIEAAKPEVDYIALHDTAELEKLDLIVWPETSYHRDWLDPSTDFLNASLKEAGKRYAVDGKGVQLPSLEQWRQMWVEHLNQVVVSEVKTWPTAVLLGLNCEEVQVSGSPKYRNSALLLKPGGTHAGRYDKIHRVPWGEYVPLKDWVPAMNVFSPYDHDYSIAPGDQMTRFALGAHRFGVLICYEDSGSYQARQLLKRSEASAPFDLLNRIMAGGLFNHLPRTPSNDRPVDFLINISNDAWFDGTSEHEEHLAICRFRAVECRRSVARAVNMGISAIIDGNGRVLAPNATHLIADRVPVWEINGEAADLPPSQWKEYKKVAGVLVANVPIDSRESLYVRWGDWLPASCWGFILLGLLWPVSASLAKPQTATK